jgi:hypothetical protein
MPWAPCFRIRKYKIDRFTGIPSYADLSLFYRRANTVDPIGLSIASGVLFFCDMHQSSMLFTRWLTSSFVLPACKHTRILEVPSGTVGGTTARTIIPRSCKNFARGFGDSAWIEKIGDRGQTAGTCSSSRNAV